MAEKLLLNYKHDITYNNIQENIIGATTNQTLRTVTTHNDANSIYVRKFGTDYLITDVTDIEDPIDVNMTFKVYALDGTLLGSRTGGGAFVDGSTLITAQGCYLEIVASGGAVTVLGTIDIDTDIDAGGYTFTCPAETIVDGDTLRLYLSDTGSTYYDANYIYGGARHVPNSTQRKPYTTIGAAIVDPDATGFTITTVLDSAVYDEQFSISISGMILQAALGQTPTITSGVGARISRMMINDGNNTDTKYVSSSGSDTNAGTYQEPYLTIQYAENNMGGLSYINILDSATYDENIVINSAVTMEPVWFQIPTILDSDTGDYLIEIGAPGQASNIYGFIINGGQRWTRCIRLDQLNFSGTIQDNTIHDATLYNIQARLTADNFSGNIVQNEIYNSTKGIYIESRGGYSGSISKNIVHNHSATGIHLLDAPGITANTIDVTHNICYLNGTASTGDGILIDVAGDWDGDCEHNTCWNNYEGLHMEVDGTLNGTLQDIISFGNTSNDINGNANVTINESNYETINGVTVGSGNILTDPEFCKLIAPYEFGISVTSGAYRTGTNFDDMGALLRIIEINNGSIEVNGFNIDGQESYNNAIYILDSADHTGLTVQWNSIYDFQGISVDLYDDDTDIDATISNNDIYKNGNGIAIKYGGNTLEENLIYSNTIYGIYFDNSTNVVNHCISYDNQYGIYVDTNAAGLSIKNSIFHLNSLYGIYSEISLIITYCCITDAVNNVNISDSTNTIDNPLFIDLTVDDEDFNIKTIENGFIYNSPCREAADDEKDIGAYDIDRSVNENSWNKYEFEYNPPQVSWLNDAKGYIQFENALGGRDNFAKGHKRRFSFNFSRKGQVSSEELRQKIEYFATLIKTRENELIEEKTKFRLHFQQSSFLESGTLATIDATNNTIADTNKTWTENQWKGFHVGIIWEHGTNMVIDSVNKKGSIMAGWISDEWIGYTMPLNGYYYFIKDNNVFQLTFSDPNETLVSGLVNWSIEKYFKISSNSINQLCVEDPDGELQDGTFDYYINFIEVKAFIKTFTYRQSPFLYDREYTKVGYKAIFEEI